jgi:adenosine kinase
VCIAVTEHRFTGDFLPGRTTGPLAANIAYGLGRLGHHSALVGELSTVADVDLVMIASGDVLAMLTHAEECRRLGFPFAVDAPSGLSALQMRALIDGAAYVFSEGEVLTAATGWSKVELLAHVGTWVVTLGAAGVRLETAGEPPVLVAGPVNRHDGPDAFRAGFLAGLGWGLSATGAAQVGCVMATHGTQHRPHPDRFLARLAEAYGPAAALAVEPNLRPIRRDEDHWVLGYD